MKKQKTKKLKTNKGITLISLVITIIVMLILVAVTISISVNGGLFDYAGKAADETKNAINAEQQLANGKIKIDGKWYNNIDDYINNKPIELGIEITPPEITLKKKETEETVGEEVLTQVIIASVFGMESEPEITWETSSDVIELSATTGKNITVTAVGTENTIVTLTARCVYEGQQYTATSKITLEMLKKPIEIVKGDFVEYGVAYTDMYISKEYTTTNGWRLLDYTDNGDGTLSNVKLISTGIPATLYYDYDTYRDWWVTIENSDDTTVPNLTTFKTVLGGEENFIFYSGSISKYISLQVSAGLYYNLGKIKFAYATSSRGDNLGYFKSVTVYAGSSKDGITYNEVNNNTSEKTGNEIFKVGDNTESIRLLTLRELNETVGSDKNDYDKVLNIINTNDSIGLYRLDQLKKVNGMSNYIYTSESKGNYWLASPSPSTTNYRGVCFMKYNGEGSFGVGNIGVRPAIIFDSDIKYSVDSKTDETTGITYLKLTPEV